VSLPRGPSDEELAREDFQSFDVVDEATFNGTFKQGDATLEKLRQETLKKKRIEDGEEWAA